MKPENELVKLELSERPLPDIRDACDKIKAMREHYRKLAGMSENQMLPSFDQLKNMTDDAWVKFMKCDNMLNQLGLTMLMEADTSKGDTKQWLSDLRTANDLLISFL